MTLFKHKDFRRLWAAQTLSAFGNRITRTAIPVIAINTLAAGPQAVAWLAASNWLPFMLAGMFGSGFVERAKKRRLMIAMDLLRFALVISVPLLAFFGEVNLVLLFAVSILTGLTTALFQNADTAYFPSLIGPDHVVEGNSKIQATESIAEITGPGLAGILIDLITAPLAMVVDAVTFLWSAFWLARIEHKAEPPPAPSEKRDPWTELREDLTVGWRAVMHQPAVRATFLTWSIYFVSAGASLTLYMLLGLRELGLSPSVLGIVIGFGGLGALGATFLAPRLEARFGLGPAILIGLVLNEIGLLFLLLAAAGAGPPVPLLIGQQAIGDGGGMIFSILAVSLRQQLVKGDELARANGLFQVASGVVIPVFGILAGVLASVIGVRSTVIIGVCLGLFTIVPCLDPRLLKLRQVPSAL